MRFTRGSRGRTGLFSIFASVTIISEAKDNKDFDRRKDGNGRRTKSQDRQQKEACKGAANALTTAFFWDL
jgi:hypothetical protein